MSNQFPPLYLTISRRINAPARLAELRKLAAESGSHWRKIRAWNFKNGADAHGTLSNGSNSSADGKTSRPVWYCQDGPQFRNEKFCDDVEGVGINHTGWFADNEQGRKIRGIVGRLTHDRFIAGYWSSDNDERVYFGKVYDDEREAARAADREAESQAEEDCEYDERWRAAQDKHDKAQQEEKEIARLFALRNHPTLGEAARADLDDHIAELRALRSSLKREYSDIEL